MTKVGRATVACVYLDCPYCGGPVTGDDGSYLVKVDNPKEKLTCDDCGKEVEIPMWAKKGHP